MVLSACLKVTQQIVLLLGQKSRFLMSDLLELIDTTHLRLILLDKQLIALRRYILQIEVNRPLYILLRIPSLGSSGRFNL